MACPSLVALARDCQGAQIGGAETIYAISFKDLVPVSSATTEVYSASSNNIVISVGTSGSTKFVKIAVAKNTAGFTESLKKDLTTGTNYIEQKVTIDVQGLSTENRNFVESVRYQPIALLVKTRTKKWFLIGADGELELSALEAGIGVKADDGQGYKMTFDGVSANLALPVDSTIIASIVSA